MALVISVVVIAVLSANTVVRQALPSESLLALGMAMAAVVMLFEMDRLG